MKAARKLLIGAVLAGFIGAAQAIPTALTDPINPSASPETVPRGNAPAAPVVFDIGSLGFDSSLHTLTSASLSFGFTATGPGNSARDIVITAQGLSISGTATFLSSQSFDVLNFVDLTLGQLSFLLSHNGGNNSNVTLDSARLDLRLTNAPQGDIDVGSVPEPTTLALLGLGLLGLGAMRRRMS